MITRITRGRYLKGLRALECGDLDSLLAMFDEHCTLTFVGDSPLGARVSTRHDIRRWFERFQRLLPTPTFEIRRLVVSGPPWRQRFASHMRIRSTIHGEPYENQFAHFLILRWGKVVDDLVLEDTQMWAGACARLVAAGVSEAGAPPLTATSAGAGGTNLEFP